MTAAHWVPLTVCTGYSTHMPMFVYKYYDAVPAIFLFAVGTVLPGQGEDDFVSAVEQLREVLRERMEMYNLELRACESMLTKE